MSLSINIRRAQPGDVDSAIPLIYSSGPHEFDYIFNLGNKTAQDYLSFAFPGRLGSQSHRVCTVATVDGLVVGIGSFFTSRDNLQLGFGNFWNILRFYGLPATMKVARRTVRMENIIPPPEADAGFICQLGIQEKWRGYGIGTALIRHYSQLALQMGLRKCILDVAITNPRAQVLYERLGFKVVQENKWNDPNSKIRVPDQRRMELVF